MDGTKSKSRRRQLAAIPLCAKFESFDLLTLFTGFALRLKNLILRSYSLHAVTLLTARSTYCNFFTCFQPSTFAQASDCSRGVCLQRTKDDAGAAERIMGSQLTTSVIGFTTYHLILTLWCS